MYSSLGLHLSASLKDINYKSLTLVIIWAQILYFVDKIIEQLRVCDPYGTMLDRHLLRPKESKASGSEPQHLHLHSLIVDHDHQGEMKTISLAGNAIPT